MKKFAAVFLSLVMLLSLAACGGETKNNNGEANGNDVTNNSAKVTSEQEKTTKDDGNSGSEITFSEMLAIDNEECSVKITGIDADTMQEYTIRALLENKSADKTYMFTIDTAAINGVQCDPFFSSDVAAGKKSNEVITFSSDDLEGTGITEYTDIELTFKVYDSNDWSADDVAYETIHIYPLGEEKAEKYVREPQASDNVIVDNDYVTVIVTGYEKDDVFGYIVKLFLVNKTDKNVMFSVDEASVNGFMSDPFYGDTVYAGKCTYSNMDWSESTLEENYITEVETIEFTLRAYDDDDWSADDFVKEIITLNP